MEFLGAGFGDAFISVLAIIGIILVGGFLIFFLGDLVLSVLDPEYVHFWQRKKNGEKEKAKEETKEPQQEPAKELEFKFDEADKDAFVKEEIKTPEVVALEEPKEEIEQPEFAFDEEEKVEEPVEETEEVDELKAEEELFKQNMLREIEERRQKQAESAEDEKFENFFYDDEDIAVFGDEEETVEEVQVEEVAEVEETPVEVEEAPIEIEAPVEEVTEEATEEVVEETAEEPVEETTEEVVEEAVEEVQEEQPSIEELKAQFEAEIAKLQARNEELENELNNKEEIVAAPVGNLEEYEARLETLKERLAANEKQLRQVKKEYIPLRKVNKTLENDERKLRRKEAIVAKQKVVLYGVNNIADIDEEKAKKLSEELDLLEGLKLSVQHCQEVMNANKDRYPILENTFNILTANNETLKADIKETEDAIENLKAAEEVEVKEDGNNTDAE